MKVMQCVTLTPLSVDDPRWIGLVEASPAATAFHHPSWAKLMADTYGCTCFVAAILDGAGELLAGLPIVELKHGLARPRWVSLPFTDYCPPLARDSNMDPLLDALTDAVHTQRLRAIEIHSELPERAQLHTFTSAVRHELTVSENHDVVYGQFSKMHRRNIRIAERQGVRIHWGNSPDDMDVFYRLHLMTRRRLGVPIQPRRFFHLLSAAITESRLGFILSAYVDDVPIAAAVFLNWNGVLVYKYGASDHRFWNYRPNNLLFWEAIRWACDNGCHTVDWGRTDLVDHGLREFKCGWGAREEPLCYSVIADSPPKPSSGRLLNALSTAIRHSPTWVCRVSGELLYRYVA